MDLPTVSNSRRWGIVGLLFSASIINYLDRAAIGCVNELTPKWASKLAGFDVFIWDQCYAIENSIHME